MLFIKAATLTSSGGAEQYYQKAADICHAALMQGLFDDPSPSLGTQMHERTSNALCGWWDIKGSFLQAHNFTQVLVLSHLRTRKRQMNENPFIWLRIQFPVRIYYRQVILGRLVLWIAGALQ